MATVALTVTMITVTAYLVPTQGFAIASCANNSYLHHVTSNFYKNTYVLNSSIERILKDKNKYSYVYLFSQLYFYINVDYSKF